MSKTKMEKKIVFYNAGKKIKNIAEISALAGIIISVVLGVFYIIKGFVTSGLVLLLGGPIACFLSGLLMYGFGELVDKTCDIKDKVDKICEKENDCKIQDEN